MLYFCARGRLVAAPAATEVMTLSVRLLSGIQPTGELHVGNYLGAIRNWVTLQRTHEAFFVVVDLHAMTVEYEPAAMRARTLDLARTLLACGIDATACTLFVQSHVPEHTELAWILNCVTSMGDLQRMTQFKDKAAQHETNINAGLFTYPVLQAADILLYKAKVVPVGEDQVQHIELTREVARRFNSRFGVTFPEPAAALTNSARIRGLDGQAKMSKSLNNHIPILAPPDRIAELLRPAFTDPARLRRSDPGHPEVCNIFALHKGFTAGERVTQIEQDCRTARIGCVDCKRILARSIAEELAVVRERYEALPPDAVEETLAEGARRAAVTARATMAEVRERAGLLARRTPA